jgi:hypothetical protein
VEQLDLYVPPKGWYLPIGSHIVTSQEANIDISPRAKVSVCLVAINSLKPKLVQVIFKNPFRTSKRTPHFTITEINWIMLLK